jgi:hypothetical protein
VRVGIAHHLGWAVVVVADDEHSVVDRRRIELIGPDLPVAPVHHEGGAHELHRTGPDLDDEELAALVARVRASAERATAAALDVLVGDLAGPVTSVSIRSWPDGFPADVAAQRRPPHESRADSVMYLRVLAADATRRGLDLHTYDHTRVEAHARALLGDRADDVLLGPRQVLGPPWATDHRVALAATVVAASG